MLLFFFNDTATTEIYTLSLHDALPISRRRRPRRRGRNARALLRAARDPLSRARARKSARALRDRKSTRLNSSHANISYAVFFLEKNNQQTPASRRRRLSAQRYTEQTMS